MTFGRYDVAAFVSFFAYASGSVVLPIALVALAVDLGFDLEEGGMSAGGALPLASTVPMVAAMLLAGFIAGRWGKRRTMGLAVVLMGVGLLVCASAPVYAVLFAAIMILGLGQGVLEALATPFVQAMHPQESGRYINFAHAFWPVGVLTTVLVAGGLIAVGVSWRLLVVGAACLTFLASALIFQPAPKDKAYPEHLEPVHWTVVWGHIKAILKTRRFWLFYAAMFLAGGGEYCLTFWSASYIQLHFAATAWAGGAGVACFAGGMFLGRTGWGYLIRQHHLNRLVFVSALVAALVSYSIPWLTELWWLFGLLFVSGLATAPFWPSIQSYSTDRLPDRDSTMMFILLSCAGVPGCGVFTWLMGLVGDYAGGLRAAFYLVPGCFVGLAVLMLVDMVLPVRAEA